MSKKRLRWHAFRCLGIDLIQTWYDDRHYCTLYFDTSLIHLDLDSRVQQCEKAKTSAPIVSQFSISDVVHC